MYFPKIQVWYEFGQSWLRYLDSNRAGYGHFGRKQTGGRQDVFLKTQFEFMVPQHGLIPTKYDD